MGVTWTKKPLRKTLKTVYDDIDNAIDSAVVGDGTVTNAKLATDVKVGSLAALTTSVKTSVQAAINELVTSIAAKYTKDGAGIPSTDMTAAVQASLALADSALQNISGEEGTPVNAVAAAGTLAISGVVIDGETVTIDTDVYEFLADAAQSKTDPANIAVDIEANTTKSTINLTVDTNPTLNDTMTIGATTYTFVENSQDAGEILIGTDVEATQLNIVAAVNGTDGVNSANASASAGAFAANVSAITALVGGTAGDSIATTETFTAGTNVFAGATLAGGADCSAANAETALVAADAGVTYSLSASGVADAVIATAATKGVAGNSIVTTETMANGAFGQGTLGDTATGVDGTVGAKGKVYFDSSYLYVAILANTIADTNWRRISLGAAY